MAILELVGVSKRFGELRAVSNISLDVEEREIRGLIGPNGSGKTTLFNLISGFLPVTTGKIIWQGDNIAGKPPYVVARRGIVRTFQLTSILPDLSTLENIIIACHLQMGVSVWGQYIGSKKTRKREKAVEGKALSLLEFMGIREHRNRRAGDLPGGTQRILAIAVALAANPRLLMLDEPVAGLNSGEKVVVMEKVKLLRDRGITVFLVEHDMKAIMNTCDKITVINFGEKIAEGSPAEVSRDRRTIEAYLGKGEYGFA